MGMDVVWIPEDGLPGSVGEEQGVGLALRKEGDEILFASAAEKPCRWVSITEFVVDPEVLDTGGEETPAVPAGEGGPESAGTTGRAPWRRRGSPASS